MLDLLCLPFYGSQACLSFDTVKQVAECQERPLVCVWEDNNILVSKRLDASDNTLASSNILFSLCLLPPLFQVWASSLVCVCLRTARDGSR